MRTIFPCYPDFEYSKCDGDGPAAHNFCELQKDGNWSDESFHYTNAPKKKGYFVNYREGIYVGYRYYETRADSDKTYPYSKEVIWLFM